VKVKVVEVDVARKRIGLTMKLDAPTGSRTERREGGGNRFEPAARHHQAARGGRQNDPAPAGAMASAFAKLQGLKR